MCQSLWADKAHQELSEDLVEESRRCLRLFWGIHLLCRSSRVSNPGPQYQDETLEGRPRDTTRLLTIQPRTSETIECTMSYVQLDLDPYDKALSYTWGEQKPTDQKHIN